MKEESILQTSQIMLPLGDDETHALRVFPYFYLLWDQIYQSTVTVEQNKKVKELIQLGKVRHNQYLAGEVEEETLLYKYNQPENSAIEGENLLFFKNTLRPHLAKYTNSPSDIFSIREIWVNFQRPGEFQPYHSHTGLFSFVWYVDIPEAIRKENEDSNSNEPRRGAIEFSSFFGNNSAQGKLSMIPDNRDFLLFHAGQNHCVYPYFSDETRISISGNIVLAEELE